MDLESIRLPYESDKNNNNNRRQRKRSHSSTSSRSSSVVSRGSRRRRPSTPRAMKTKLRRSPSYDYAQSPRRARSRGRGYCSRSCSSSSRGTYDDFEVILDEDDCPHGCKECRRGFYTIRELAEHELNHHDGRILCAHCDKEALTVTKLAAHMLFRHADKAGECDYCGEKYGNSAKQMVKQDWQDFRNHVYKCALKKAVAKHQDGGVTAGSDAVALRGIGKCPHGPAAKCKNFPNCPGAKCIYAHGMCRYDITCNKQTCPFDHTNRHRTCMACVNEIRLNEKKSRR